MFSYLEAVKKVVNSGVYNRGLKFYLDGFVGKYEDLSLDFWRAYEVFGTEKYTVKVPLLHLAMSQSRYDLANRAIVEICNCSCPYFSEYGICKHIVGVMASLEQEFNFASELNITKQKSKDVNSLLESMFEVDLDKKIRRFQHLTESFVNSSGGDTFWFDEILIEIEKNPENYKAFLKWMENIFQDTAKTFEGEIRLISLIKQSWYRDSEILWLFWLPFLQNFEPHNLLKLNISLWKIILVGILKKTLNSAKKYLQNLSDGDKQVILENLQKEFPNQTKIYIDFAIAVEFTSWIESHIEELDPLNLLLVSKIYKEYDIIENLIYKQMKVWSDFLQPQTYAEIAKVFQIWLKVLGRTEYYELALKYVKENHAKKKKLLALIEK